MSKQAIATKGGKLSVEIAGGLGNQLFMFYGGLFFSKYLGRELEFSTSDLAKIKNTHPGLNLCELGLLGEKKTYSALLSWVQKVVWKIKKNCQIGFLCEKLFPAFQCLQEIGFAEPHTVLTETRFLKGYFQTWRYFDLLPEKPILNYDSIPYPSAWFKEMMIEIERKKPAVVHVRRGDYGLKENKSIGLLSAKYYDQAVSHLDQSKQIWIFSDSPDLVKSELNYKGKDIVFIRPPNDSDPVESLLLMSMAPEIVISNSTFSWWAAFLSGGNSRVFAPTKWYKSQLDPVDLIPGGWMRIESKWK